MANGKAISGEIEYLYASGKRLEAELGGLALLGKGNFAVFSMNVERIKEVRFLARGKSPIDTSNTNTVPGKR